MTEVLYRVDFYRGFDSDKAHSLIAWMWPVLYEEWLDSAVNLIPATTRGFFLSPVSFIFNLTLPQFLAEERFFIKQYEYIHGSLDPSR